MASINRRVRFSLRSLFVITTLTAVAAYWWFALPTVNAKRFVAAIEQKQFDLADQMFNDAENSFLVEMTEQNDRFEVCAHIEQPDRGGIWTRDRVVVVDMTYGTWSYSRTARLNIKTTKSGLSAPIVIPRTIIEISSPAIRR